MPKRKEPQTEIVSIDEIPPEVIGAVVLADLAQIEADAATHPDAAAQGRIQSAVRRLREIAQAEVSPSLLARLSEINAIMSGREGV